MRDLVRFCRQRLVVTPARSMDRGRPPDLPTWKNRFHEHFEPGPYRWTRNFADHASTLAYNCKVSRNHRDAACGRNQYQGTTIFFLRTDRFTIVARQSTA